MKGRGEGEAVGAKALLSTEREVACHLPRARAPSVSSDANKLTPSVLG